MYTQDVVSWTDARACRLATALPFQRTAQDQPAHAAGDGFGGPVVAAYHTMSPLTDPFEIDCVEEYMLTFEVQRKQRDIYLGACFLVYQRLMQILIECLMGWKSMTKTGKRGIFRDSPCICKDR